jgi:hypothetical protein
LGNRETENRLWALGSRRWVKEKRLSFISKNPGVVKKAFVGAASAAIIFLR